MNGLEQRVEKRGSNPCRIPVRTGPGTPSLAFDIAPFFQELPEPFLSFREMGPGDQSSESDPILFRDIVQYPDGRSVPEQDPLGIDSHGIVQ
jgi:hypothetical protein